MQAWPERTYHVLTYQTGLLLSTRLPGSVDLSHYYAAVWSRVYLHIYLFILLVAVVAT